MDRQTALLLTIVFFVIFIMITYYGAQITLWSSIVISVFLSLIILVIFYPISRLANDDPDFTLVLYAIVIIFGIFLLGIYIINNTLLDIRCDSDECLLDTYDQDLTCLV